MKRKRSPHSIISSADAERATYIDFEGFTGKTPALLGILIEDRFEQVILDEQLLPVASATGLRSSSLIAEAKRLLDFSVAEERFIVAYSQHELKVIAEFANLDLSDRYRDARMIANRWRSSVHPDKRVKAKGLKDYLELIEYRRPAHLGNQKSTKRLKAVRDMLRVRKTYQALSPVKKQHWTKLLSHNRIDCYGMQVLVVRAASELERNR
jgi:hypothetical protein